MQHGGLDKTKVLKTQRDFKSDERKPNFKSVLKSIVLVRPILHLFQNKSGPPDLSDPFNGFQRCFPDMSGLRLDMCGELYDHWNLNTTGLVRPFFRHVRVLTQTCHLRGISSVSGLSQFWVTLPVWLVWWTSLIGLLWQLQRLVFSDSYKRHSNPSLVGCWFLTICITFQ
jgi:hypothetical protein